MTLESKIESILFWKGEPVTIDFLSNAIGENQENIIKALDLLETSLVTRGITLQRAGDKVALGTAPENSQLIAKIKKEELSRDLGKAATETLSIILYKGPVSRRDIDYIRGVNSTFIIRNLMIRGLVERSQSSEDSRTFLYSSSIDLLSHLGLSKVDQLPEFHKVKNELADFSGRQNASEESPGDANHSKDASNQN